MSSAAPARPARADAAGPAFDPSGGLLRRVPLALSLPEPTRPTAAEAGGLRVGLLGGSFNPAHEGHRHISFEALRRLRLDQVWWLVSPQNPLKPRSGMAPLATRLAGAARVARHPRIKVTALEARFGTHYTIETLKRLTSWPRHRFVWLIGADNLQQLPAWRAWTEIFATAPVAVFERHPYSYGALFGIAARRFSEARVNAEGVWTILDDEPPCWTFLRMKPHPASATAIRQRHEATVDAGRWGARRS